MTITKHFPAATAHDIESLEAEVLAGTLPPTSRQVYLAALLIGAAEYPVTHYEVLCAATWMYQQGRLVWKREPDETIVQWQEHLN
jgi:hypothetical protein